MLAMLALYGCIVEAAVLSLPSLHPSRDAGHAAISAINTLLAQHSKLPAAASSNGVTTAALP